MNRLCVVYRFEIINSFWDFRETLIFRSTTWRDTYLTDNLWSSLFCRLHCELHSEVRRWCLKGGSLTSIQQFSTISWCQMWGIILNVHVMHFCQGVSHSNPSYKQNGCLCKFLVSIGWNSFFPCGSSHQSAVEITLSGIAHSLLVPLVVRWEHAELPITLSAVTEPFRPKAITA